MRIITNEGGQPLSLSFYKQSFETTVGNTAASSGSKYSVVIKPTESIQVNDNDYHRSLPLFEHLIVAKVITVVFVKDTVIDDVLELESTAGSDVYVRQGNEVRKVNSIVFNGVSEAVTFEGNTAYINKEEVLQNSVFLDFEYQSPRMSENPSILRQNPAKTLTKRPSLPATFAFHLNHGDSDVITIKLNSAILCKMDLSANFSESLRDTNQSIANYNAGYGIYSLTSGVCSFSEGSLTIKSVKADGISKSSEYQIARAELVLNTLPIGESLLEVTHNGYTITEYVLHHPTDAVVVSDLVITPTLPTIIVSGMAVYPRLCKFDVSFKVDCLYEYYYEDILGTVSEKQIPANPDNAVFNHSEIVTTQVQQLPIDIRIRNYHRTIDYLRANKQSTPLEEWFADDTYRVSVDAESVVGVGLYNHSVNDALALNQLTSGTFIRFFDFDDIVSAIKIESDAENEMWIKTPSSDWKNASILYQEGGCLAQNYLTLGHDHSSRVLVKVICTNPITYLKAIPL